MTPYICILVCHASENILAFLSKESFKFDALQFHVETTVEYTQEEKRQQQWLLSVCTTQIQPPNPDLKDTSAPVVASLLVQTDANFGVDMLTGTWGKSTELYPY